MVYTSEYFGLSAANYANNDLVQLIGNYPKEDVNFIKITKWIDGTVINSSNKAKYYLSSTLINNYFEFTDLESFNDFIIKLDNINNFIDKTHVPKDIPSHNKMFINGDSIIN